MILLFLKIRKNNEQKKVILQLKKQCHLLSENSKRNIERRSKMDRSRHLSGIYNTILEEKDKEEEKLLSCKRQK